MDTLFHYLQKPLGQVFPLDALKYLAIKTLAKTDRMVFKLKDYFQFVDWVGCLLLKGGK